MNSLQAALVNSGLARKARPKKSKKRYVCDRCGEEMFRVTDTNAVVCPSCGSFFVVGTDR